MSFASALGTANVKNNCTQLVLITEITKFFSGIMRTATLASPREDSYAICNGMPVTCPP